MYLRALDDGVPLVQRPRLAATLYRLRLSSVGPNLSHVAMAASFSGHVGPAVVALGADILERLVLDAVADFLRYAGLAGEDLPRPAEVGGVEARKWDCSLGSPMPRGVASFYAAFFLPGGASLIACK
jgi:hypothetical protein